MPPVGFETTILADERPKNYALDRAATGTDIYKVNDDLKSEHSARNVGEFLF